MEEYNLKKTFNTPEIILNPDSGHLRIEGRAIPEDPGEFFEEIIDWVIRYFKNPRDLTRLDIKLEYINSGSSKYMLELLRLIKSNYDKGHDCLITWFYEEDDESIYELGQHYMATVKIPFKMEEYF